MAQWAPPVVMGTWHLGGATWGPVDDAEAGRLIRSVHDLGVTTFDTARGYGASEELLGRYLRPLLDEDRDSVKIATKGGHHPGPTGSMRDNARSTLRRDVETSLTALGVDYLDLYQMHWPDPDVPMSDVGGTFAELRDEGKIRAVGLCNVMVDELDEFLHECPVQTLQVPYSALRRGIESDLLPHARELGIDVMAYGALAHGVLTHETVSARGFAEGDWRRERVEFGSLSPEFFEELAAIESAAVAQGWTLAQLAIAYCLRSNGGDSVIVGAHSVGEVEEALQVSQRIQEVGELLDWVEGLALPQLGILPLFGDGKAAPKIMD